MVKLKENKSVRLIIVLCIILFLFGCSSYKVVEKEVVKERIVYLDRNITINNTVPCEICLPCLSYNYTSTSSRELELIRRIKFLESQTDKYFNDSECNWKLNNTEVKLEECELELCLEWNSSWC